MVLLFWSSNKKTIGSHWDHIKWFIILQINCKHGDKINNLVHLLKSILAGLVSKIQAMSSDQRHCQNFWTNYENFWKFLSSVLSDICKQFYFTFDLWSYIFFFFLTQFNDFPILSSEFMTHVYYIESGGHYCVI